MARAKALAMRVACNEEGNDGDRGKSNWDKGGRQGIAMRSMATVTVMAPTWAMVTAMRLAGNTEGKGKGGKGNGNGDEGGGQQRGQWWQGNGDGNKDGRQANSNGNEAGNVDGNKGGG